MTDQLITIGSIALHINENFNNISAGVSGNMIEIVDQARQFVENYIGESIGSLSIPAKYQNPIIYIAKSDVMSMIESQDGAGTLGLAELNVGASEGTMSSQQWKLMAENSLKNLGRKVRFSRSLS